MSSLTLYRMRHTDLSDDDAVGSLLETEMARKEVALQNTVPGRLFLTTSTPRAPEWAAYLRDITTKDLGIGERESVGALLLLTPPGRNHATYAMTWGIGHFLLRRDRLTSDLGLRCALNLLAGNAGSEDEWDPARIRALRTRRVGPTTLLSEIQASRSSSVELFPVSLDADQIRQITGTPGDVARWGSTVTGGVSLHVRRPPAAAGVVALCKDVERVYRSTTYRERYAWLDNVSSVSDPALRAQVLTDVLSQIKAGALDRLSLAPPALIAWEAGPSFEFRMGRDHSPEPELAPTIEGLHRFLEESGRLDSLTIEDLERCRLQLLTATGERGASWTALECLTCEVALGPDRYILDEGGVFQVAADYLRALDRYIQAIPRLTPKPLASRAGEHEAAYNQRLASSWPQALLLDKKTVTRADATAIEVCDVLVAGGALVHVKRGTSSSSLSHLFGQGVVSAELLHMDEKFRARVTALLRGKLQGSAGSDRKPFSWLSRTPFPTSECTVGYLILTGRRAAFATTDLPFFSKVHLRMKCEELRRMGFRSALAVVGTT